MKEVLVLAKLNSSRSLKMIVWILFASFSTFAIGHGCSATGVSTADSDSGATSTSTSSSGLAVQCYASALAYASSTTCYASGGTSPYVLSLSSGGGYLDASTGTYTAPSYDSNAQIIVTDALGAQAYYSIAVLSTVTGSTATSGRTAVYRSYNSLKGYYYSTSATEGTYAGYSYEGVVFYLLSSSVLGSHPVYKCRTSGGLNFMSLQSSCESSGSVNEGLMGYVYDSYQSGTSSLSRYHWNDSSGALRTFAVTETGLGNSTLTSYGYVLDGPIGYGFLP